MKKVDPPDYFDSLSEKQFGGQLEQLCKLFGWRYYHTHNSRFSAPGYPDYTLVRERVIFAELKREDTKKKKYKLSASQIKWRDALLEAKQEWYLWRPRDMDDIAEILR